MARVLISAFLALCGLAACAQPAPPAGARLLGNLKVLWGDPCWNSKISPDSRHLLWCAGGAGAWQAMVDGRAGARFAAALGQDGEQATHPSAPVFHFSAPDRVNYLVTSVPYGDDDGDQVERGRTRKDLPVYLVEETLGP